jgi:hypothetical protein
VAGALGSTNGKLYVFYGQNEGVANQTISELTP